MFFSFFGGKCQLSSGEAIHEFKKGTTKKSSGGTNENENGKERCGLVSGVDDNSISLLHETTTWYEVVLMIITSYDYQMHLIRIPLIGWSAFRVHFITVCVYILQNWAKSPSKKNMKSFSRIRQQKNKRGNEKTEGKKWYVMETKEKLDES